jgi:hypothetical protein
MKSTTEFGYTFDYYDELYQMVSFIENDASLDWDWEEQADELGQCLLAWNFYEYDEILPFEQKLSRVRCFTYLLGRTRARYDEATHTEFYNDFLENYDEDLITFEQV